MPEKSRQNSYADIRPWVKIAVAQEDAKPSDQLWENEPSEEKINKEHQKRICFRPFNSEVQRADFWR